MNNAYTVQSRNTRRGNVVAVVATGNIFGPTFALLANDPAFVKRSGNAPAPCHVSLAVIIDAM